VVGHDGSGAALTGLAGAPAGTARHSGRCCFCSSLNAWLTARFRARVRGTVGGWHAVSPRRARGSRRHAPPPGDALLGLALEPTRRALPGMPRRCVSQARTDQPPSAARRHTQPHRDTHRDRPLAGFRRPSAPSRTRPAPRQDDAGRRARAIPKGGPARASAGTTHLLALARAGCARLAPPEGGGTPPRFPKPDIARRAGRSDRYPTLVRGAGADGDHPGLGNRRR
jgi:hypothetical protein